MFKGFQDTSKLRQFNSIIDNTFNQNNNVAYGYGNVTFWLDAAYGLNTNTNLGAISTWSDRITNTAFIQTTAGNQPILITSDTGFNNLPCIEFQDTSRRLTSSFGIGLASTFTLAIVYKTTTLTQTATLLTSSGNNSDISVGGTLSGFNGFGVYDGNTPVMMTSVEDSVTHIAIVTNSEIVMDGAQKVTGTVSKYPNYTSISNSVSNREFVGKISEIIVLNKKLNSSDCITLSDNINKKYAIY